MQQNVDILNKMSMKLSNYGIILLFFNNYSVIRSLVFILHDAGLLNITKKFSCLTAFHYRLHDYFEKGKKNEISS